MQNLQHFVSKILTLVAIVTVIIGSGFCAY